MPECQKTNTERIISLGYPKMYQVSLMSVSVLQMDSNNNIVCDIANWLQIGNVKEANCSNNFTNYIQQILKYNDSCTSFDYIVEIL